MSPATGTDPKFSRRQSFPLSCTITTFAFALNYHVRHPHPPAAMAQGAFKQSTKAKAPKAVHSKKQASKVSKPKKNKAGIDKAHKKFTSGLTAKTEALLGERAGHLELLGGKGKRTDKRATVKAGSKKFG